MKRRKRLTPEPETRFVACPTTGCWLWEGATDEKGYGLVYTDRSRRAHRVVYERIRGPIPEGLQLDHLCAVKPCVNPAHLEPVTNSENQRRNSIRKYGRVLSDDENYARDYRQRHREHRRRYNERWARHKGYGSTAQYLREWKLRNWSPKPKEQYETLGERNNNSKLTSEAVLVIRQLFARGTASARKLAAVHGVSAATVYAIVTRKTWRHA